ncbi:ATP-binding protein [Treponema sp.]|uniref:ATP-binding protein n=1 Tax=Treponema sp. TaxID=166 RepID=UPI00298E93F8|nr:ATP-binding protein [Treponema sp.]
MQRDFIQNLIEWKDSKRRKPLILTGVRQCGKTYLLKEFGSEYFDNFCYINFESAGKYSAIFEYDYDVKRILREIELAENVKITAGKTLLIFDEIQECPKAITSLKYFCENLQELHLVCAGSLLGVAIKKENISFPVGKVNRMQLYPMSFKEYLQAVGEGKYIELFNDWNINREIPELYTVPLERHLKNYYIVGGMPEAVKEFAESGDYAEVAKIQDEILSDYSDDFSKHAPISEIEKIRMIWDSIPKQLAKENNKFVFSHVKEGKRAHELEAALQWLKNSGLVHLVELVQNAELPLSSNADSTYFKVYMADSGLLCRRLGLSYKNILEENTALSTFKGAITENYVLQELIVQNKVPYFWRSGNTAELDFLFEEDGNVIPVEVKAATNTQAKSFKQFCKKYQNKTGFKLSLKNIAENDCEGTNVVSLPLYLLWNISLYH